MKVSCSGYRNPQDLVFRDQTKAIQQRIGIQASQQITTIASYAIHGRLGITIPNPEIPIPRYSRQAPESDLRLRQVEVDPYVERLIQPSEEDIAISYFFSQFAILDSKEGCDFPMEFLSYMSQTGTDNILSTSIISVGMAVLANISRSPSRVSEARRNYIHSLSLTRVALEKLTTLDSLPSVHLDAVFMSVLLLAMVEVSMAGIR